MGCSEGDRVLIPQVRGNDSMMEAEYWANYCSSAEVLSRLEKMNTLFTGTLSKYKIRNL